MATTITYTQQGDYLLPDLQLPEQPKVKIGVFGQRHKRYLQEHHKLIYFNLLTSQFFFIVFFMLTFLLINQLCNQWRLNCYFLLKKIPLYGTIETESFYFGLYSSALSVFYIGR